MWKENNDGIRNVQEVHSYQGEAIVVQEVISISERTLPHFIRELRYLTDRPHVDQILKSIIVVYEWQQLAPTLCKCRTIPGHTCQELLWNVWRTTISLHGYHSSWN